MTSDRQRRDDLLERILELAPAERAALLDAECGVDAALRADVERLAAVADGGAEHFLEEPACTVVSTTLRPGTTVDRYIIESLIGSGGMGAVYRARDPDIDRSVALKVMRPIGSGAEQRYRFLKEVRALGSLRHGQIVRVYDAGEYNGHLYFVTELLEGEDLATAIAANRCGDLTRRLDVAIQIAEGLRGVHAAGMVHRDVKPSNVFLTSSGEVKLLDFGIARDIDRDRKPIVTMVSGTPAYMSPEQASGASVTPSSDVYAFGLLLFELLGGRRAYRGKFASDLDPVQREQLALTELETFCAPTLVDVVRRATHPDPAARLESFDEILQLLRRISAPPATPRRGKVWWAALGSAAAIGATAGVWLWPDTVTAPRPVPQVVPAAHVLRVGLEVDRSADRETTLTGAPLLLRQGDRFRLRIAAASAGHLYVFGAPVAGGTLHVLFPSSTSYAGSSRIDTERDLQVPEASWLEFGPHPGRERLWVAWSAEPYQPFEGARRWSNDRDRGVIGDADERDRLQTALGTADTSSRFQNGRWRLEGAGDLLVGVIEFHHQ